MRRTVFGNTKNTFLKTFRDHNNNGSICVNLNIVTSIRVCIRIVNVLNMYKLYVSAKYDKCYKS